jgi:DNA-directed RNA polymerase-3 subunit RPC5
MEDFQDEVVREIDVFVTDSVPLFLLQFPLKPVYADSIDISAAKFKPVHKKMELDVPFLVPESYPRENIANVPKTQKFQSSVVAQEACLGAGIVKDNTMYITPIQSVLQLRPSFKNMLSSRAEITEQMDDDVPDAEPAEGEGDGLQQVTLKRKESEKAQSSRIQSYSYLKAQEDHEQWKELVISTIGTAAHILAAAHSVLVSRVLAAEGDHSLCVYLVHSHNRICRV